MIQINPAPAPLLEARGITKRFGTFEANRDIDFAVRAGERHALLGQNGAGKSTLVKIIYGVLQPSAGELRWDGVAVAPRNPAESRGLGIGMVFQDFSVFAELTVLQNIALALPAESLPALARRIRETSAAYGMALEPDAPLYQLSVGERQRVEVLRCLLQDPRLLIMDEPTSVLTPQEAESLFRTLRQLSEEGRAILYISHRLEEVRELCNVATILRDGEVVDRCDPRAESNSTLAEKMIGKVAAKVERGARQSGSPRLVIDRLDVPASDAHGTSLREISLEVRAGEVLGIAGVAGEGQSELMDTITGEVRARRNDSIRVDGVAIGGRGPNARRLAGMAFVPEERNGHAAIRDMTLDENVLLTHYRAEGLAPGGWIRPDRARDWTARIREQFDVRAGSDQPTAGSLSGGNLQKFIVGREILRDPGVLVASQPTWGVDAGAAAEIRGALVALASRGAAVLVISQDLDEIFEICDRIAVIHRGRLSSPYPAGELTAEQAGLLMGGATGSPAAAAA